MGDIISSTSVINDIKKHFTRDQVYILTSDKYKDFFYELNFFDNIIIDNREFLPRYHINSKGSMFANSEFGLEYSIDLMPVGWLNDDNSISPSTSMYIQDSEVSWSLEMWGRPDSTQFFGIQFPFQDTT